MPRNLSIRGVPDEIVDRLQEQAAAHRRSMNGEVIAVLEAAVAAESGPAGASLSAVREPSATYAAPASPLDTVDRVLLADVCRRHSIRWLAAFGSWARGEARRDSDVDVVAEFEPGRTPGWGIVRVADALRPVFGGRPVDLVTARELGRLRGTVLSSARTLYGAR